MAEYEAGTLHAVDPPQADLDRIRADPALSEQYSVSNRDCTYYYGFDQNFPETGDVTYNVHLRRALSYAIDRQAIVDNVTKGGQQPARWMARPGLVAAPTVDTHPDAGIGFDPEAAQAELALALEELGVASAADLPTITLGFGDVTSHAQIAQAVQQMWTDTLGITVQLTPMDTTTYFDVVSEDPPPIYRSGWCSDYVDANNFLRDTFGEDSSQNDIGFLNDEFNALLDQAYTMTDVEARRDIYAQAENILVRDEAVLMPIYWYTYNQLTRDCVTRNYPAIGSQRYEKWDMDC
jgi:oligopeptide transport system substrate-binding protein